MFPVETFELFQQFHSMPLFSPVPRCLVLVIGTNSNRKNGKENNAKTSSARGILRQLGDLISITSAQGRAALQQGMDPLLEPVPLGWAPALSGQQDLLTDPHSPSKPLIPAVNSNRLFAGVHFA